MMMKPTRYSLLLFLGTIILMTIGFYNGYPLVYSDTGTYIYSGFDKFIPVDRPFTYGLFLNFFSLKFSLWLVIFVQNMLVAFCILELFIILIPNQKYFNGWYLGTLWILTFVTGIGWYSNQIMPDIFTPVCVMLIAILVLEKETGYLKKGIFAVILSYSLTTHFSNLWMGAVLMVALFVTKIVFGKYVKENLFHISFKKLFFIATIIVSAWILLPCINLICEKKFILSKGSHVFLMAHLDDTGILKKFLDDKCNTPDFKECRLCMYKDSLPGELSEFMWSGKIVEKTGGWLGSEKEYNRIIRGTLIHPRYLFLNIYKSFTYGCIQLANNDIGQGLTAYTEDSPPYGQIKWHFRDELNNYLNSRQNKWNGATLNFTTLNIFHRILLIISLLFIIAIFTTPIRETIQPELITFIIIFLLAIIINAFVTGGLNAPCERYQARIVWLLPLALFILMGTISGKSKWFFSIDR